MFVILFIYIFINSFSLKTPNFPKPPICVSMARIEFSRLEQDDNKRQGGIKRLPGRSQSSKEPFAYYSMIKPFQTCFMKHKVTYFYFVDLDDLEELVLCGSSIKELLEPREEALRIEERVYSNLVRVFYLNMEFLATRLDKIIIKGNYLLTT